MERSGATVTESSTKSDIATNEWAINDSVTHLREWGIDTIRLLPQHCAAQAGRGRCERSR